MRRKRTAAVQDAQLAAVALHHGHALLPRKQADVKIFAGLTVETYGEAVD